MEKTKSAGLVVLSDVENLGGIVAWITRRVDYNREKMASETYRGAYQVTAHGKCKNGEDEITALKREITEELGFEFFETLPIDDAIELNRVETDSEISTTYGIMVNAENLKKIPLSIDLKPMSKQDMKDVRPLYKNDKYSIIASNETVAMFPNEIEAVKLAFEKLVPKD